MTTSDYRRQRMCAQSDCERRGQPTFERKCPICGTRTPKWDPNWSRTLAPRSGTAAPPPLLIVTTNDVPRCYIAKVHGDVFGLTVRTRNMFSNAGAGLRTFRGGEAAGYTKLLTASRNEARGRLIEAARDFGANAVVAMRFDCNEIGDIMTEIAAYGTAVTVVDEDGEDCEGPPAGWYEQLPGSGDFRWWDGNQWDDDDEDEKEQNQGQG
jgi:uncharacterized protein YbjQ (UPF0145 family)